MAPYHIRKYQERDQKTVVDLFYKGMVEHIPATFRHTLMLPQILVFLIGVPFSILLVSGSWLLAFLSDFTLLVLLRLFVGYPWKQYVVTCLRTDLADITKSYLSASDSCFWVAESGGQVVGTVGALPVENPPPGKKQLQLFHLSVAMEHRREGIAKALVRTVLQFARDQGYGEVVLDTSIVQQSAIALYLRMGFQETGQFFFSFVMRLVGIPTFHLTYHLPSAGHGGHLSSLHVAEGGLQGIQGQPVKPAGI
ncbi:PREDICTED: probable N-acetyltransferase CML1 isoform X1 [Chinchilla lanigera]|uniref:Probable N-acetyltransferase CML1 n=1 Tax=Chinchilla lanigera TaxID=34839 RepID=A0A8C2VNI5_CHILA|nr:PREDICTED: probable N-acetyltransferase CML1 isoform X1 [Chinchilla lanigera]XP_005385605.1 PREDICTED: probable N-acetyltransferase CML1 isoform X1 [Chinchilla lanigera]XP_005385606.1 PREDICTED: probable N-acetyltransferase CML1 isoform X1 [Chinchilla lanigera]XP_005385608.1 PREDICTED: probable N-acetyltransferase CML1 isoform X1 [Chinchilla lanigera]XP_013370112.1 PREDICTED: probable N-acetyltransferase CML1 isoform X1 [Chinchilla lanigera]XP_013370113.1 PREDICTED: probable N-acetyltransfe